MKTKDNPITVYWCHWLNVDSVTDGTNLECGYTDPVNVLEELASRRETQTDDSFFRCPVLTEKFKNMYMVRNMVNTDLQVRFDESNHPYTEYLNTEGANAAVKYSHPPSLKGNLLIEYDVGYGLFADEPLLMAMSSPYFHRAEHLQYGAILPGAYDIGRWYRPIVTEFNLWEGNTRLHVPSQDPLMYWDFHTDRDIVIKRYEMTDKLKGIMSSIIHATPPSPRSKLWPRYDRFERSSLKTAILEEINKNLVE